MARLVRENAFCASIALAACAVLGWLGLYGFAWTDYESEAQPAVEALAHLHLLGFLRLAPVAYGGSLIERAPFALAPGLWGGGELAVYRMMAVPCLLALAALGVYLVARMRARRAGALARGVALALCVANPMTLRALELGHPEEILGACMVLAAVLAAARGRALWAGALLGLAIANKEWALLALGPVLLALEPGRRLRCAALCGTIVAVLLAPMALSGSSAFVSQGRAFAAAQGGVPFQPWQLWWFLGATNHVAALAPGAPVPLNASLSTHPHWRLAPSWLPALAHPLILAVGLGLALTLWLARRRGRPGGVLSEHEALLALALVMLVRCLLDTWDVIYYLLPFVLALLSWEVLGEAERPPVLALSCTVLAWISFQWLPERANADVQSAFFLAWTLPLLAALARALYRPSAGREGAQAITVRSFPSGVSTSAALSVRTTRSSMRTPS